MAPGKHLHPSCEDRRKGKPVSYLSKANFRDHDGHIRDVTAFGKTKTAAERAVLRVLIL